MQTFAKQIPFCNTLGIGFECLGNEITTHLPFKKELVLISGFFEIAFGFLLLFHKTRFYASWGIILLLIAVFPANIYLYLSEIPQEALGFTKSQALVRMPFQIPLLIIAYWHSMESSSKSFSIFCCLIFIPTIIYFGSI